MPISSSIPQPSLAPRLLAALDKEEGEFVRPALIRALAAVHKEPKVTEALIRDAGRGVDFFRSTVIEALGDYKVAAAVPEADRDRASIDGPLQDDAATALGKIGDKTALGTLAELQRTAPKEAQPAIAAAICLMGTNCSAHIGYLEKTLTFADTYPGLPGPAARRRRRPRQHRPAGQRRGARASCFDVGIPSQDPVRAPVTLALGLVALRNTPLMLKTLEALPDQAGAIGILAEAFDMLEEDLEEERFFVAVRRAYWAAPDGSADAQAVRAADHQTGLLACRTPSPGPKPMDYKSSGVDIDAGNETVRRIKRLAQSTFTPGVLSEIGSFGGLFKLDTAAWSEPVLVSSADGVGTKLKVAFMANQHRTIGVDLVNHCVNDILVQGAVPLFFLDYLATGKLSPDVAEQIVEGLARACKDNGCALLGGETAEMPGFYDDGEYDVAGFIVGAVDRARLIDGRTIAAGDVLIGLPSSGLHTNGYSLARKIAFEELKLTGRQRTCPISARRSAQALLRPHRSYLPVIKPLLGSGLHQGHGAHHRRRHHRQPAARAAAGHGGARQPHVVARAGDLPLAGRVRPRPRVRPAPRPQHGHRHDPRGRQERRRCRSARTC